MAKVWVDAQTIITKMGVPYNESSVAYKIRCINPSHEDVHPSGSLYKDSGAFHCFSCGHHVTNYQLAAELGCLPDVKSESSILQLNERVFSDQSEKPEVPKPESYCELPKGFENIEGGYPPLNLTDEMAKHFDVGVCSIGLTKIDLTTECDGCPYKENWLNGGTCGFAFGRIMIPIRKGKELCSIESRVMDKRYSSKKVLYPTGSRIGNTIFNYDNLNSSKPLYVVEGIKGALRVYKEIDTNVTALFSNLPKGNQKELLLQFPHVILIPDLGDAGKETVKKLYLMGIQKLEVVELPEVHICKKCNQQYEKKPRVCSCGSSEFGFGDVYDLDLDVILTAIKNRKSYMNHKYSKTSLSKREPHIQLR